MPLRIRSSYRTALLKTVTCQFCEILRMDEGFYWEEQGLERQRFLTN